MGREPEPLVDRLRIVIAVSLVVIAISAGFITYVEFTRLTCTTVMVLDQGATEDLRGELFSRPVHTCFDRSGNLIERPANFFRGDLGGNFEPRVLLNQPNELLNP